ncbi:hypothetical protein KAFR_0D00970 [Kazachstania africana CBS 2517]|uniref:Uncharacterized protein n=1 Tax=Kazachstania africana (strain ATCC 22294 / BCRC 22015 / CBS 2517 / CECT 1963 / NBRC 1671 / NRRL Y-8276) TaxID=1071382 RepID=H2ATP4_KAZAF|nr:hypothetical protein KAFR_0D00970 [Kazachstania africana CBS 2517]CCF57744.1 hypothetical protein KAFR_0D00970 [Kazachstania africana CBS 2517]
MSSQLSFHNKASLPPQEIIDLFKRTFNDELYADEQSLEDLHKQIQQVKSHLYDREYITAFDDDLKRTAYCCRWSPSRAISYASLFAEFPEVADIIKCASGENKSVLCVGGGAGAELAAISSIFAPSRTFDSKYKTGTDDSKSKKTTLNVQLVDISDWSNVVTRLSNEIKSYWLYNNEHEYFNLKFTNCDILNTDQKDLKLPQLNLITSLFTTSELFMEQKAESIRFFQKLNKFCSTGCLLLIVESAGSYSHITVGSKKFPIQFLIDTILVGQRGHEQDGQWELLKQNDSIWYRTNNQLDYPIKLENMRFFYRLYRKK